jgi:hypothetical protein
VPGPDAFVFLVPLSFWFLLPGPDVVLAYGPAPGLELIPYFLGLLAWAGLALAAIILAPLSALLRRIRKARRASPAESKTVSVPESPDEGSHERA